MIRIIDSSEEDVSARLRSRAIQRDAEIETVVSVIIADVRKRGDAALLHSARKFDAPAIQSICIDLGTTPAIPRSWSDAIRFSASRIRAFHEEQLRRVLRSCDDSSRWPQFADWKAPSGETGQRVRPLGTIGVYVPGGRASYPSSVLMNAIPATCAGVGAVYVCSPAAHDGSAPGAVRAAMREAGVNAAFAVGGAAAIAAFAIGTESVPRADKVVGPGNVYVNEAKRQLWGQVGLDGYAGPSEVCVVADKTANPAYAAADLLTQVEHAPDNAGFLICDNEPTLQAILGELSRRVEKAPRREILEQALSKESLAILVSDRSEAAAVVNEIAPEHLSVMVRDPELFAEQIMNAGCILIGDDTPESAADWVIGPSHTIPTSGATRFSSPVNVLDFLKVQSVSAVSRSALSQWLPNIEAFGEMEGFPGHAAGARVRFGY